MTPPASLGSDHSQFRFASAAWFDFDIVVARYKTRVTGLDGAMKGPSVHLAHIDLVGFSTQCSHEARHRTRGAQEPGTPRTLPPLSGMWALLQQTLSCLPWVWTSTRPDAYA